MVFLAALVLASTAAALEKKESYYVDASLEPGVQLLGWEAVDGLAGARPPLRRDVVLAVLTSTGRELRMHACMPDSIEAVPRRTVAMLDDVIAWGSADLRPDPGAELLLLTRGGAWSYSILKDGYRGNAKPIARTELVYDLPNPEALPHWAFVLPGPVGKGQDRFLLPSAEGYHVWSPDPAEADVWTSGPLFAAGLNTGVRNTTGPKGSVNENRPSPRNQIKIALQSDPSPFVEGDDEDAANLLSASLAYRSPALLDVDGDGSLDLLDLSPAGLALHRNAAAKATSVETLPEYLTDGKVERSLRLADLDGDGDIDILARLVPKTNGIKNKAIRLLVLLQDGGKMFPAKPDAVLRFDASELRIQITDVNGDKRPDLVLRKFELPGILESVGGLEFTFTHLVYFGGKKGFERKPSVKATEVYDEESIAGAIANYELTRDCDNDGVADLVALDLEGRLAVRRVVKDSGFFSGDSWELERAPWKRFETRGAITSLSVPDLNGDGLGDLVSLGGKRLTVMLSMGRRRSK